MLGEFLASTKPLIMPRAFSVPLIFQPLRISLLASGQTKDQLDPKYELFDPQFSHATTGTDASPSRTLSNSPTQPSLALRGGLCMRSFRAWALVAFLDRQHFGCEEMIDCEFFLLSLIVLSWTEKIETPVRDAGHILMKQRPESRIQPWNRQRWSTRGLDLGCPQRKIAN